MLGRVVWHDGGAPARQARVALSPAGEAVAAALCAVRVSRRLAGLPEPLAARFLRGTAKGGVFASTFLSAGERELFALLAANGGRMVAVKERGLGWVYRPGIHEAPLLAEGRLAVLGLGGGWCGRTTAGRQEVTREGSLMLNVKIADMAAASGGVALRVGGDGTLEAIRETNQNR